MANDLALIGPNKDRLSAFYHTWHQDLELRPRRWQTLAFYAFLFLLCAGTVGAMAIPIGGAILAQGRLVAEGRNRVVEHLEGGIVREVFVRQGERVEEGQLLARVDVTAASSKLTNAEMQRDIARVRLARNLAEQVGEKTITFPPELMARAKAIPEIGNTMDAQRQEFVAKRAELTALREILTQRVTSNTDLIKNLQIILKDRKDRLAAIEEEVRVSDDLLLKGLTTRDRNYNLRRQLAVDQEQIKNLIIQIDEKGNAVNEAREQLNRVQAQREKELTDEILKLQAAIIEYNENIRYLSDVTGRSEARAPVSGIVVKVATNTRNQVIKAGEPLFEIFPDGVPLGVEIKVPPTYIDTVFIGQGLSLRFPSRERESSLKTLEGTVTFVSRDSEVEERTGRFFYTVRASIDPKSAEAYGRITPGNVGEVYFRLQDQTLFWYLFEPMFLMSTKTFVG